MKKIAYHFDPVTKIYESTVVVTEEELSIRRDITLLPPNFDGLPDILNRFINGEWVSEDNQISPLLNKTIILADGVDRLIITKLPEVYTVEFNEEIYRNISDTVIEITINSVGEYPLIIYAVHHKAFNTTINAI